MTVTFLVAVDISDGTDLTSAAEDISEAVGSVFDVQSVHPWARPNNPEGQPAGGFTSLNTP